MKKLLKFYTETCKPCITLDAILDRIDLSKLGVELERVDVEKSDGAITRWRISAVPTLIMLDQDGSEINRISGMVDQRRLDRFLVGD